LFHTLRSHARERLGLSCGIRGNGWCVTHALLARAPYRAFGVTEDIEYGNALGLAGCRVHYAGEAEVRAPAATAPAEAERQRQRWEGGRFALVRAQAPALLRECVGLAREQGVVSVVLEPIALYHAKDLHEAGDGLWTAPYVTDQAATLGSVETYGEGQDLLVVTFGNGVPMSLRAARRLEQVGIEVTVLDLRWLSPLPVAAVVAQAQRFTHVLVVDETRASGGVADAVVAALTEAAYAGTVRSVRSADSYVPLGPAARRVLVGEDDIVVAAISLVATDG